MDTATEIQTPEIQPAEAAPAQVESADSGLSDALTDPLLDTAGGGEDAVQMILPPKPGTGPKVGDTFQSVDEILAGEGTDQA